MVEVIGHRGASKEAPENTLISNQLAFSQGADGIEVDVRMTKDGQLVCMHDKNILRTTGIDALVKEKTLLELKSMNAGMWKGNKWTKELIPSLDEVLKAVPEKKKIFIEMKEGEETVEPLIYSIIESPLIISQISVISFLPNVVKKVKEEMNEITVNLLIAFEGIKIFSQKEVINKLEKLDLDGVAAQNHKKLKESFVRPILEAKKRVHVWTVDSVEEAKKYVDMGMSSITTNVPGLIQSSLQNK